jgi:hypothetical protein
MREQFIVHHRLYHPIGCLPGVARILQIGQWTNIDCAITHEIFARRTSFDVALI